MSHFAYDYPRPAVTVDIVVFRNRLSEILLIRRLNPPFEGLWALPGGFMDMSETLEETATRELQEETSLTGLQLKQLHAFSSLDRDPRHRTISVVFYCTVDSDKHTAVAGSDAKEVAWFNLHNLPPLAFDHAAIIALAVEKLSWH
ncbi:MAG TPA: NUDIX hydrolase [Bacteroidales bacterium]|nr:NUDIX hydrolase [Bacteroidales bacterium]